MVKALPKRPFLLRAMHQWIAECGHTPHVIVDAAREGAEVPRAYVKDGKIVLNLSEGATQRLHMGNEEVEFDARFAGVIHHVRFPVSAVLGIYARETGEGMVFSEQDLGPEPPTRPTPAEEGGARRPQLKVVK
ncbi:MAG TPA: ClpXP protease specificity-enhancing factor [Steroidobacteraceae bacterium]|nr:ClpXP protease specificity-enhancing factor [Steroidobacteraceae bacterium]